MKNITPCMVHAYQGCGVGSPVLRLLAISIIRPSAVLVT